MRLSLSYRRSQGFSQLWNLNDKIYTQASDSFRTINFLQDSCLFHFCLVSFWWQVGSKYSVRLLVEDYVLFSLYLTKDYRITIAKLWFDWWFFSSENKNLFPMFFADILERCKNTHNTIFIMKNMFTIRSELFFVSENHW